ncbi:MAG: Unknown protein [uncultured Thiotrichaceae bacterium]|uniref:Uncharacterized protein n=1 Tax=uncultured Thiotrichaceae bacterium TaxID=298394 RepID=A0A6S6TDE5_9GAMM|nr:MAG: Unknown protein [uncultured Thiotrichaceae bacterium]
MKSTEDKKRGIQRTVIFHALLVIVVLAAFTYSVIQQGAGA